MKKISKEKLNEIIENHKHWLHKDVDGWEDMRCDLRDSDLSGSDLRGSNLRDSCLSGCDLSCSDLSCSDLRDSDLRGSNLRGSNLRGSNLSRSNLSDSNLRGSNLSCSDLRGSNLSHSDLRNSNLNCCNLSYSNLSHSNLSGSNLSHSNLTGSNLYNVKLDEEEKIRKGIKLSRPMIGWKKCEDNVIVKLEIPRGAIVFSINNNKCRTDKCIVKEIIGADRAYSRYKFFSYYVGDVIEVFDFNCEYNVECEKGIHFFRTKEEAENHY